MAGTTIPIDSIHRQTRIINESFLMCYFMHFDPISSQIQGVFQPYFWSGLGEFLGSFFIEKKHLFIAYLHSLMLFATFY